MMLMDDVTELLWDGKWHSIHTIAGELNQPEQKILEVLKFCAEFNIVAFDESGRKVKIDRKFRSLFD
jgi:hypothetical protein